jgi:hypothetical protein
MNDDEKLSQGYRQLGAEEPPRRLDEAILAASRRAADARPAPLVAPAGRRRWYFPVAAAAVITLAVAVTIHVEREQPDPEAAVAMRQAPAPAPAQAPKEEKADEARAAPPAVAARRQEEQMRESAPMAGARAREPEAAARRDFLASKIVEPPEKWLERIAELRKAGKHEEADKALEEFRKRYPDYKLPESVLRKR